MIPEISTQEIQEWNSMLPAPRKPDNNVVFSFFLGGVVILGVLGPLSVSDTPIFAFAPVCTKKFLNIATLLIEDL